MRPWWQGHEPAALAAVVGLALSLVPLLAGRDVLSWGLALTGCVFALLAVVRSRGAATLTVSCAVAHVDLLPGLGVLAFVLVALGVAAYLTLTEAAESRVWRGRPSKIVGEQAALLGLAVCAALLTAALAPFVASWARAFGAAALLVISLAGIMAAAVLLMNATRGARPPL